MLQLTYQPCQLDIVAGYVWISQSYVDTPRVTCLTTGRLATRCHGTHGNGIEASCLCGRCRDGSRRQILHSLSPHVKRCNDLSTRRPYS